MKENDADALVLRTQIAALKVLRAGAQAPEVAQRAVARELKLTKELQRLSGNADATVSVVYEEEPALKCAEESK